MRPSAPRLPLLALLAACSAGPKSSGVGTPMPGFDPGAVPAGYQRYLTPVIDGVEPGADKIWCQWLTAPLAADEDVLAVSGAESKEGHHVVLYATSDPQPVGTTRECTTSDMLSLRFLGFVGGEGGSTSAGTLPPGVAFRVPAGMSLMANVHFINAGSETIRGQAAVDVEMALPTPGRTMASFFVNTSVKLAIQPRQEASFDVSCLVKEDLPFLMVANHMHASGVSAFTEVVRADGTRQDLARSASWSAESQFNPAWSRWSVASPVVVHAGDTVHTQCTWQNAGASQLTFPGEMCAGLGFILASGANGSGSEIQCVDGVWSE